MKYKLIASDMDETLLNDHHEICSRNIELIKKQISAQEVIQEVQKELAEMDKVKED